MIVGDVLSILLHHPIPHPLLHPLRQSLIKPLPTLQIRPFRRLTKPILRHNPLRHPQHARRKINNLLLLARAPISTGEEERGAAAAAEGSQDTGA